MNIAIHLFTWLDWRLSAHVLLHSGWLCWPWPLQSGNIYSPANAESQVWNCSLSLFVCYKPFSSQPWSPPSPPLDNVDGQYYHHHIHSSLSLDIQIELLFFEVTTKVGKSPKFTVSTVGCCYWTINNFHCFHVLSIIKQRVLLSKYV